MKKMLVSSLVVLLMGLFSASLILPTHAGVTSREWIKPAWENRTGLHADPFLGDVTVAYLANSTWILNLWVLNDAVNATGHQMDARVYRIAVWFDWNKFYNTSVDVSMKYSTSYLFTINGTMEQVSNVSNLFTHSYKIYVEYEITYQAGGSTVTEKKTWGPYSGDKFAVISQTQYDLAQAAENYAFLKAKVSSYVDDYAESYGLYVQAETEASTAASYYGQGEFSSALQHYDAASDLLGQSWTVYTSIRTEYDDVVLNQTKANLEKLLADINAIKANATAKLMEANALSTAIVVNSVAVAFFGLGFMFFGVAAIVYASRRPKTE